MITGFKWILPKKLAGSGRPGLIDVHENDIEFLDSIGIKLIVTLTEDPIDPLYLDNGFDVRHFPIRDMSIPTPRNAEKICSEIVKNLNCGVPVLVHCKAGLGRTGTILACTLVSMGRTPKEAIVEIRSRNRSYIQTNAQEKFVYHYEDFIKQNSGINTTNETPVVVESRTEQTLNESPELAQSKTIPLVSTSPYPIVENCINDVPGVIACGLINLDSSDLLSVKISQELPVEVINVITSAAIGLFEGEKVSEIERIWKRAHGVVSKEHYFKEMVCITESYIYIYIRQRNDERTVLCMLVPCDANLAMVLKKARTLSHTHTGECKRQCG